MKIKVNMLLVAVAVLSFSYDACGRVSIFL